VSYRYTVVDAFARRPLEGNPVAVFHAADGLSAARMQRIARELNLSETTFVLAPEAGGDFRVRIFTPVNELPFAGHPTLGTAIALGESLDRDRLRLETAMGMIPCELADDGGVTKVEMRQPLPTWQRFDEREALLAALGVPASVAPVDIYRNGPRHVFVGLESVAALSALEPDQRALSRFEDMAVNCFAGAGSRWRARMFSPAYGVVEDAATGSAAGPLAVHLARYGLAPWGQDHEIEQGVEMGRRSVMYARAVGSGEDVHEIFVGGHGVVVARGELYLEAT
jgi:trans-2,3-dihydro-3-hydroxyanthranilate isomerase